MKSVDKEIYIWQCVVWIVALIALILALRDFGLNKWFGIFAMFVIVVGVVFHFEVASIAIEEEEVNNKEPYY